eukprot:TRINITY_DN15107_c1_g2_i1.p2 TRINITY_DN15107_c1_g2~~TRINITY_DN15107_c1_g2_i1.p2  ORF type:complete len:177 (+),score=22.18 TRINITY_DN15107_c1_g2_i1:251-781(+)
MANSLIEQEPTHEARRLPYKTTQVACRCQGSHQGIRRHTTHPSKSTKTEEVWRTVSWSTIKNLRGRKSIATDMKFQNSCVRMASYRCLIDSGRWLNSAGVELAKRNCCVALRPRNPLLKGFRVRTSNEETSWIQRTIVPAMMAALTWDVAASNIETGKDYWLADCFGLPGGFRQSA